MSVLTPKNFIVCYDTVYKYFIEYMITFIHKGFKPVSLSELYRLAKHTEINEIILVQKGDWFPSELIRSCKKIIIANTEQLCHAPVIKRVIAELQHISSRVGYNVHVIDYSLTNKSILENYNISCSDHLVEPPEYEIAQLKTLLYSPKKYDIGFVGYINPRRRYVLEKLKEKGYNVLITETFGEERDKLISQCKSLINIHCEEYFNIFESIRCNRWLAAGLRVLTEVSVDCPAFDNLEKFTYDELCTLDIYL